MTEGLADFVVLRFLAFFPGLEAQPSAATPQALRASSTRKGMATHTQLKLWFAAHLAGEPKVAPPTKGIATHTQLKLQFAVYLAGEPRKWLRTIRQRCHGKSAANQKPPLLGEVARRSCDGEVSGLRLAEILGFFPGLEAPPGAATPQALRASSPSRGAF